MNTDDLNEIVATNAALNTALNTALRLLVAKIESDTTAASLSEILDVVKYCEERVEFYSKKLAALEAKKASLQR